MIIIKEAVRRASYKQNLLSVKDVLKKYIQRSDEELESFSGTFDELMLTQTVRVLRKEKCCIGGPQITEEFVELIKVVKSITPIKEVENVSKNVLRRTRNPRK